MARSRVKRSQCRVNAIEGLINRSPQVMRGCLNLPMTMKPNSPADVADYCDGLSGVDAIDCDDEMANCAQGIVHSPSSVPLEVR